jgi:hypothetical protein
VAGGLVVAAIAFQGYGLYSMAPCWLSDYNVLVGGLNGAKRLGLPVTYWGDGVTRTLLEAAASAVPQNGRIAVAPVLHAAQWQEVLAQCPALRRREVQFVSLGSDEAAQADLLLFFPRLEYLPESLRQPLDPERIVASVERDGVVLAALYRMR